MTEAASAQRRVTPTAYLVLPADAPRDAWLAERRNGIGSSDVPDILGVGHKTTGHVFWDKRGRFIEDDEDNEAMLWGRLDEDTTAREWARRNRSAVRRVGLVACTDAPHLRCTLDRRVTVCPLPGRDGIERCALEVKHTGAFRASRWRRNVPDEVLAQTLHQIIVTGYDHIHVACRIGGNDYRQYMVRGADYSDLIADIRAGCDAFWFDNVKANRPPSFTGEEEPDSLLDLDRRLYPVREDAWAELDDPDLDLVTAYGEAAKEASAAKDRQDAAKAALVQRLAGKQHAALRGDWVYSFADNSPKTGASYTYTKLNKNRLHERWPEAWADVTEEVPQVKIQTNKKYLPADTDS